MRKPPVLLCLDLAATSGWAYGPAGLPPKRGTWMLGKAGTPRPVRLRVLRERLLDFLAVNNDIDEVGYEAPMSARVQAKIGSTAETAILLIGACAVAEMCAHEAGRDYSMHDVQDVREHFLGRRTFKEQYCPIKKRMLTSREVGKRATMARCKLIGAPCDDDNQADAVALHYFMSALRSGDIAVMQTPLFGGVAA